MPMLGLEHAVIVRKSAPCGLPISSVKNNSKVHSSHNSLPSSFLILMINRASISLLRAIELTHESAPTVFRNFLALLLKARLWYRAVVSAREAVPVSSSRVQRSGRGRSSATVATREGLRMSLSGAVWKRGSCLAFLTTAARIKGRVR
jgi:hypothetical protein